MLRRGPSGPPPSSFPVMYVRTSSRRRISALESIALRIRTFIFHPPLNADLQYESIHRNMRVYSAIQYCKLLLRKSKRTIAEKKGIKNKKNPYE